LAGIITAVLQPWLVSGSSFADQGRLRLVERQYQSIAGKSMRLSKFFSAGYQDPRRMRPSPSHKLMLPHQA